MCVSWTLSSGKLAIETIVMKAVSALRVNHGLEGSQDKCVDKD